MTLSSIIEVTLYIDSNKTNKACKNSSPFFDRSEIFSVFTSDASLNIRKKWTNEIGSTHLRQAAVHNEGYESTFSSNQLLYTPVMQQF